MIGIIIATHGALAEALLKTAESARFDTRHLRTLGIFPSDDAETFEGRLREAVGELSESCEGVLVLTDMFGGSPSNIGMTLHREGKVEILTSVNLPMLIKVLQCRLRQMPLYQVAKEGRDSAVRSIAIASDVLAGVRAPMEKSA